METYKSTKQFPEGTSLQGSITTSCAKLTELFGKPSKSDGYKISTEWTVVDEQGNILTIYDYKSTRLYNSKYPTIKAFRALPEYEWHIGATDKKYADELIKFIKSKI